MHLQQVRRINHNTGRVSLHWLKIEKGDDGVIKRTYVRKSDLDAAFMESWRYWMDRKLIVNGRKFDRMNRPKRKEIRAGVENLGLTMRSSRRVCRSRKNYFKLSAARNRFELLDDELRDVIGTPETLLMIDKRADSILHSLRAQLVKGVSAKDCFAMALEEHLEKKHAAVLQA